MMHGFTRRTSDYIEINMTDLGCTITVQIPAKRKLKEAEVESLQNLLQGRQDVLARLCFHSLEGESFEAYDGGELSTSDQQVTLFHPVRVRSSKGVLETSSTLEQGKTRLAGAFGSFSGEKVRLLSIVSDIEVFFVYTDPALAEYVGCMRTPLTTLNRLVSRISQERGPSAIGSS